MDTLAVFSGLKTDRTPVMVFLLILAGALFLVPSSSDAATASHSFTYAGGSDSGGAGTVSFA